MVMIQNGLPWWYFDGVESAHQGARLSCLDPDGELQREIPLSKVVGAVIYRPVTQTAPGKIFLPKVMPPKLQIGEVDNRGVDYFSGLVREKPRKRCNEQSLADRSGGPLPASYGSA
jgi:hypothetical protein